MIVLTRKQAYDLAWSGPMRTIAAEVGISDVAISKVLRAAGIPLPQRGYWNKSAVGKAPKRTRLPEADLATVMYVRLSGSLSKAFLARFEGEPGEITEEEESIDVLTERFRKRIGKVPFPSKAAEERQHHPHIRRLLDKDERIRQKKAAAKSILAEFYTLQFDSPEAKRRLRFLSGLFHTFRKFGGDGSVRGTNGEETSVRIGSWYTSFQLRFHEKSGRASRLRLTAHLPRGHEDEIHIWEDDDNGKIESKLLEILVGLSRLALLHERVWTREIAERNRRDAAVMEEQRAKARAAELAEAQRLERARREAAVQKLVESAQGAHKSELIRDYVARTIQRLDGQVESDKLTKWREWALALADSIDPFKNADALTSIENFIDEP